MQIYIFVSYILLLFRKYVLRFELLQLFTIILCLIYKFTLIYGQYLILTLQILTLKMLKLPLQRKTTIIYQLYFYIMYFFFYLKKYTMYFTLLYY